MDLLMAMNALGAQGECCEEIFQRKKGPEIGSIVNILFLNRRFAREQAWLLAGIARIALGLSRMTRGLSFYWTRKACGFAPLGKKNSRWKKIDFPSIGREVCLHNQIQRRVLAPRMGILLVQREELNRVLCSLSPHGSAPCMMAGQLVGRRVGEQVWLDSLTPCMRGCGATRW